MNRKEFAEYNWGAFTELIKVELNDSETLKVIASFPVMSMKWVTYDRIQSDYEDLTSREYDLYVPLNFDSIYSVTCTSKYANFFRAVEEIKIRGQFLDDAVRLLKAVKKELHHYNILSDNYTVQTANWNQHTRAYIKEYFEKNEVSKN